MKDKSASASASPSSILPRTIADVGSPSERCTGNARNDLFLPGVPIDYVLRRLENADGKEVEAGKFASSESSAALAVNTFGWFITRPRMFPPFPGVASSAVERVEVEYCARFPWSGGRHPWLDASVDSADVSIGVESKRFEPFRDRKDVSFSDAYDRPVWGDGMRPFEVMRDRLRSGAIQFERLDATQLVNHAFGLITDAGRRKKRGVLLYLYAEPSQLNGTPLSPRVLAQHRAEITAFSEAVAGAAIAFHSISYREWLSSWSDSSEGLAAHRAAIVRRFDP